ncbi:hypothetical protein L9F63_025642, partial [Diploptera punctata]
ALISLELVNLELNIPSVDVFVILILKITPAPFPSSFHFLHSRIVAGTHRNILYAEERIQNLKCNFDGIKCY